MSSDFHSAHTILDKPGGQSSPGFTTQPLKIGPEIYNGNRMLHVVICIDICDDTMGDMDTITRMISEITEKNFIDYLRYRFTLLAYAQEAQQFYDVILDDGPLSIDIRAIRDAMPCPLNSAAELSSALQTALDRIDQNKQDCLSIAQSYFTPVLLLLSSGCKHDLMKNADEEALGLFADIKTRAAARRLRFLFVNTGPNPGFSGFDSMTVDFQPGSLSMWLNGISSHQTLT